MTINSKRIAMAQISMYQLVKANLPHCGQTIGSQDLFFRSTRIKNKQESHPSFSQINKIGNNGNIGIRSFTSLKNPVKNVTPSGNRTWASPNL